MSPVPSISVIIPTYNRPAELRRTLFTFQHQTIPDDQFEVIVVDDGSTILINSISKEDYPFCLRYIFQSNQGDAAARNNGALQAKADLLIFIDDDITVEPDFIENIHEMINGRDRTIVIGNLLPPSSENIIAQDNENSRKHSIEEVNIHFTHIFSGFMAVKRDDYFDIGMMVGLTGKGPDAWCDVDFGYRGHLKGYRFIRCPNAIGYHHDNASSNLKALCRRWENASKASVLLFQKYPDLQSQIPMYDDKTPIDWDQDSPSLVIRKSARTVVSTPAITYLMEALVSAYEYWYPSPRLLRPLYRWITSSYMYRGFRQGLRTYGYFNSE